MVASLSARQVRWVSEKYACLRLPSNHAIMSWLFHFVWLYPYTTLDPDIEVLIPTYRRNLIGGEVTGRDARLPPAIGSGQRDPMRGQGVGTSLLWRGSSCLARLCNDLLRATVASKQPTMTGRGRIQPGQAHHVPESRR